MGNFTQTTSMRNYVLLLALTFLFFSCNTKTEKKTTNIASIDSSTATLSSKNSERFVPSTKNSEIFDTLIADRQLRIIITKTDLDSYVTHEYEEAGKKQIDKYRDAVIALTIKEKSQTLLDTVFRKEQFSKYGDKGFIDIAIFHNYWFKKLDKDKLEFFGVISEPETDWTIDFHHYFDLTTKKLTFKQEISDDE